MKSGSKTMILELLPVVGEDYGIFLQRARLPTSEEYNEGAPILGAGIDFSRDLAQAKAISEIIERYTLSPQFSLMRLRTDVPINIRWADREFILSESDVRGVIMPTKHPVLSSACHLTSRDTLQAAMSEAIEREHLVRWCRTCHNTREVFLAELNLHAEFIPPPLRKFLLPKQMRFVFSWCRNSRSLPAVVCLALNIARDSFYATSSSSPSPMEAIEKVLLDCVKIFLMEEFSLERGFTTHFDHPLGLLPFSIREKIISRLPPLTIDDLKPDIRRLNVIEYCGFLHFAPWASALGRYVISIANPNSVATPSLFRCFQ